MPLFSRRTASSLLDSLDPGAMLKTAEMYRLVKTERRRWNRSARKHRRKYRAR